MDYRDRLQCPKAYNIPGHAHELTFSCYHRYPFLSKERTCLWLAESLISAKEKLNYSIWAYVFMSDHVHLIVSPQNNEYNISDFLKAIKEPVSRKAVNFLKKEAPQWLLRIRVQHGRRVEHHFRQQGRGYDRNIDNAATLQKMIDYLHLNPVRAGLVEKGVDWMWSSARWFEGQPLNQLEPDPIPGDWIE